MRSPGFYDLCSAHYDDDYAAIEREDDVAFYVAEAARRGRVLEMGCGSGRVTLPTARAGITVVGVDSSPGMLGRLRRRLEAEPAAVRERVTLVEGDLRSLDLGRTFPLVTAPFRVIQHLLNREDQRAWLRNVARHLEPGGELLFDVFQSDYGIIAGPPSTTVDLERTDPETGAPVHRLATAWHTPELQTFRVRFEWRRGAADDDPEDDPGGGATEVLTSAETETRWFTRAELENLLELEGYEVLDIWGDFARTPHGEGAEDIVFRARRRT